MVRMWTLVTWEVIVFHCMKACCIVQRWLQILAQTWMVDLWDLLAANPSQQSGLFGSGALKSQGVKRGDAQRQTWCVLWTLNLPLDPENKIMNLWMNTKRSLNCQTLPCVCSSVRCVWGITLHRKALIPPYTKNIDFLIPLLTDGLTNALCTKQCVCVCIEKHKCTHLMDCVILLPSQRVTDTWNEVTSQ